jgi:hypothetical protein
VSSIKEKLVWSPKTIQDADLGDIQTGLNLAKTCDQRDIFEDVWVYDLEAYVGN